MALNRIYVYTTCHMDMELEFHESAIITLYEGSFFHRDEMPVLDDIVSTLRWSNEPAFYFCLKGRESYVPSGGYNYPGSQPEHLIFTFDPSSMEEYQSKVSFWYSYDYVKDEMLESHRYVIPSVHFFFKSIMEEYQSVLKEMVDNVIESARNYIAGRNECPEEMILPTMEELILQYPFQSIFIEA